MFFIDSNNIQPNKTLGYSLTEAISPEEDARSTSRFIASTFLLVGLFLATAVFVLLSLNTAIAIILSVLTVLSAIPFAISFTNSLNIEDDVRRYDADIKDLIKKAGQPLISADGTTVRFAYEFIDAENSTTDVLVLKSDDEQVFMTPLQYGDTSQHVDPAFKQAIDYYVAHERLTEDEILERVQTVHTAAQHRESERVLGISEQFYKNTTQPIDTTYYRSLKAVHVNVADDLKQLETFQDDNLKENAEILKQIQTKG